ncbi:MAG: diaminopimelate epimerase [Candidatus Ancillula sp.]|jgi:diaminopimelate epimerase|nr:diaminopimelate epimerase [Candidatus Ancillula sp.]
MSLPKIVYKGHGMGNDFIIYDDFEDKFEPNSQEIQKVCDRHFGIGADGLIRLTKKDNYFMDYRNADGSIAEMCGNGTRVCLAFLRYLGFTSISDTIDLETRAGIKKLSYIDDDTIQVDMGEFKTGDSYLVNFWLKDGSKSQVSARFVDMGNPHLVAILENEEQLNNLDLTKKPIMKPNLETGANFEFAVIENNQNLAKMRVFERGVGETLSCGTGICATGIVTGQNNIQVPGGVAGVEVHSNQVKLSGPAKITARIELLN